MRLRSFPPTAQAGRGDGYGLRDHVLECVAAKVDHRCRRTLPRAARSGARTRERHGAERRTLDRGEPDSLVERVAPTVRQH